MYCTIPLKNRNCIIQSINCTLQQQQGVGGSFRYCTSSLYHLNLSPFYQTPLQAVCRYKVTYGVTKCMFSASIELALLRRLDKFSQFSKGSFNPSGVLLTQFAWIAPAWATGSTPVYSTHRPNIFPQARPPVPIFCPIFFSR